MLMFFSTCVTKTILKCWNFAWDWNWTLFKSTKIILNAANWVTKLQKDITAKENLPYLNSFVVFSFHICVANHGVDYNEILATAGQLGCVFWPCKWMRWAGLLTAAQLDPFHSMVFTIPCIGASLWPRVIPQATLSHLLEQCWLKGYVAKVGQVEG